MKAIAIVPARMGSSRFPGKPLAKILGIPMVGHCYYRCKMCEELIDTYVATCDREIAEYVQSIGGKAVMTSSDHERATDRTAEAMLKIEEELGYKLDVVVMVQGDEPMVTPTMISESLAPFSHSDINVVNLTAKIESDDEFVDPNEIKVVMDENNYAIYFSREPIPTRKKGITNFDKFKQVCIIPFRRDYLLWFNSISETPLEKIESVDMLRIIENGESIKMVPTDVVSYSVDTDDDRIRVEKAMQNDVLVKRYSE